MNKDKQQEKLRECFSKIPENYFENFQIDLVNRIESANKVRFKYKDSLKMAAGLLVLLSLGFFLQQLIQRPRIQPRLLANLELQLPDTLSKYSRPVLVLKTDSEYAEYQHMESVLADTISLNDLSDEDILPYLLELEDFEF